MRKIPDPVKVSPLIKFFRYSFLIAGILYGAMKLKTFKIIESSKKEEREQRKRDREAKLAQEKQAASERDIAQIVAIFTGKPEVESPTQTSKSPSVILEAEEVGQVVKDEKTVSLADVTPRTVEEVKQAVQDEITVSKPEHDVNESEVPMSSKTPKTRKGEGSIFSGVFDLAKSKSDALKKEKPKQKEQSGYFVETFADEVPFAEPEANNEDFFKRGNE